MKGEVLEIFSSVQGEGKYLGCRQIFVRSADCNLRCAYCDTNFARSRWCRVQRAAWSTEFDLEENPLSARRVTEVVKKLAEEVPTQAVSFTGGEPLMSWEFVGKVARAVKEFGLKIFLETNGTLAAEYERIAAVVDVVSMDIKLPSAGEDLFAEHEKFLRAARAKDLYVKIVVTGETRAEEFAAAVKLVASVDPNILLIVQPVTPQGKVRAASAEQLLSLQALALRRLKDVRVIPQTHKVMNLL